ncbi:unnamed protein product [Brassica napus]|uniref:(rape) hypothetical protein n=1 Tax=Brassica napus TaxID=3708 RepID=A0A816V1S8_BRANA|nr:unnamed protein product [Brassica napus]
MFGKTSKLRSYLARPSGARVASGRFANTETGVSLSLSFVSFLSFLDLSRRRRHQIGSVDDDSVLLLPTSSPPSPQFRFSFIRNNHFIYSAVTSPIPTCFAHRLPGV